MKANELLSKVSMKSVPRSHNIDLLGWHEGYMVVKFLGKDTLYVYGANVPQEEELKIIKNPYPDKLFTSIIKNRFKCFKIEPK